MVKVLKKKHSTKLFVIIMTRLGFMEVNSLKLKD